MIAFPSQEKGNALYTLHNRIFHLSDSGIEFTNLSHFQFIQLFLDWSVWSYSHFIYHFYQTWMESAKFSIHFSILLDQESFIKFSNHLAFISDLEVGQIQFISHFYQTWFSATNYHLLKSFCNEKESGFRFNSFANNNLINIIR